DDLVGVPAVAVNAVGAKGGHLDLQQSFRGARPEDLHHAEADPDGDGAAEKTPDLFRTGVGGDVIILRNKTENLIAHPASCTERLVPGFLEAFDHVDGKFPFGHGCGPAAAVSRPMSHLCLPPALPLPRSKVHSSHTGAGPTPPGWRVVPARHAFPTGAPR